MKVIKFISGGDFDLNFGNTVIKLKEGHSYVINDPNAISIYEVLMGQKQVVLEDFSRYFKQYKGEPLDNKTIIFTRTGGAGDILFMSPLWTFIKEKYPTSKIYVSSAGGYKDLIADNPNVDLFCPMPTDLEYYLEADYHVLFEKVIEESLLAEYYNAYLLYLHRACLLDQFMQFYGDRFREKILPVVNTNTNKDDFIKDLLFESNIDADKDIIIAFHPVASAVLRTYPMEHSIRLIDILEKRGYKVIVLGSRSDGYIRVLWNIANEKGYEWKNVIDFSIHANTYSDTITLLKYVDMLIAVDSSLIHIGGALKKPLIGLYGPFDSKLRLGFYKNAISLSANIRCAPCFTHSPLPCKYHLDDGASPCMALLSPEWVIGETEKLIDKLIKPKKEVQNV